jgi:hypothetical protein
MNPEIELGLLVVLKPERNTPLFIQVLDWLHLVKHNVKYQFFFWIRHRLCLNLPSVVKKVSFSSQESSKGLPLLPSKPPHHDIMMKDGAGEKRAGLESTMDLGPPTSSSPSLLLHDMMKARGRRGGVGRSEDDIVLKNTHKAKEVIESKKRHKKKQ